MAEEKQTVPTLVDFAHYISTLSGPDFEGVCAALVTRGATGADPLLLFFAI